ncbi:MAG: hypothetical protein ABIG32_02785 [Candidatus Uhrbacteria bacterium]
MNNNKIISPNRVPARRCGQIDGCPLVWYEGTRRHNMVRDQKLPGHQAILKHLEVVANDFSKQRRPDEHDVLMITAAYQVLFQALGDIEIPDEERPSVINRCRNVLSRAPAQAPLDSCRKTLHSLEAAERTDHVLDVARRVGHRIIERFTG